jgi:hypothetical protein
MESKKPEWPEEALGLRLVRIFLSLPPEKRQLALAYVEQLSRELDQRGEGAGVSSP